MTKTATKTALRALPALRSSLLWYKREQIRALQRRIDGAQTAATISWLTSKLSQVRAMDLADLRASYMAERIGDIRACPRFALRTAVPSIAWLSAG